MIVVTVGTQLPFDRLVRSMDLLVPHHPMPAIAQIGMTSYAPRHLQWHRSIPAIEFDATLRSASVIVSHAGTGTILMAQKLGKPIVVMPRRAALGEHRNDHQLGTVAQLLGRPGIFVAMDEGELEDALHAALASETRPIDTGGPGAELRISLRAFIVSGGKGPPAC